RPCLCARKKAITPSHSESGINMDRIDHNRRETSASALNHILERGPTPMSALALHPSKDQSKVLGRQESPLTSNNTATLAVPTLSPKCAEGGFPIGAELREPIPIEPGLILEAIIEACSSRLAILNDAGTILYVNKAWRELADQPSSITNRYGVGLNYLEIWKDIWGAFDEEAEALAGGLRRVLSGQEPEFSHEYCRPRPTLQQWLMMRAVRFDLPGLDEAFWILVTHEDITERKRTEQVLRDLGSRLIDAQEEERRRIARELHDGLNQRMALLSIELEQLAQEVPERQSN